MSFTLCLLHLPVLRNRYPVMQSAALPIAAHDKVRADPPHVARARTPDVALRDQGTRCSGEHTRLGPGACRWGLAPIPSGFRCSPQRHGAARTSPPDHGNLRTCAQACVEACGWPRGSPRNSLPTLYVMQRTPTSQGRGPTCSRRRRDSYARFSIRPNVDAPSTELRGKPGILPFTPNCQ